MKVLHINVRLTEGGAARVALDLHRRMLQENVDSVFCYGYGKKAGSNPVAREIPNVIQCANRGTILSNFLLHRFVGKDIVPPGGRSRKLLFNEIDTADIVHLHVIHSYFLPYSWFLMHLAEKGKKVIWTIHDSWLLTGRCAITDGCEGWERGCGCCSTHSNYPPSLFDFSRAEFARKHATIRAFGKRLAIVCLTEVLAETHRKQFPDARVWVINNGIDLEVEEAIFCLPSKAEKASGDVTRILIIANDLSYNAKTDPEMVKAVAGLDGCEIHTVGKNSPFDMPNIINHGEVCSRDQLMGLYHDADLTLFTSKVDTFGLVVAESLVCGTPVVATNSPVAKYVLNMVGGKPLNESEIITCIREKKWHELYHGQSKEDLRRKALRAFSGKGMCQKYLHLYEEVLA